MKGILYSTLCFLLLSFELLAQSGGLAGYIARPEKKGDRLFQNYAFQDALEAYQQAMKEAGNDALRVKIAETYKMLNQPAEAEKWYSQVEAKETAFAPEQVWAYAEALSSTGKYPEAEQWYRLYQKKVPTDGRVVKKVKAIRKIAELQETNAGKVKIEAADFNSAEADFSPAFYKKGLVFISGRSSGNSGRRFQWDQSNFLDLYHLSEESSAMPEPFDPLINSAYHEGPVVFYENGTKLIFTRNNYKSKAGKSRKEITKLNLYFSEYKEGRGWTAPEPLPFNSDEFSTGHPTISSDGNTLYFSSDRPGGFGGTDIYKVEKNAGVWQEPVNMGGNINTEGDEFFPFLFRDQQLFFAGNGHGGLGGLDIFGLDLRPDRSSEVINPGAPLNSPSDDFGLVTDSSGLNGYFSSNREGGKGKDDVYRFTTTTSLLEAYSVTGNVLSVADEKPLEGVAVYLLNELEKVIDSTQTGKDGHYRFEIEAGRNYQLKAKRADLQEKSTNLLIGKEEGPEWVADFLMADRKSYSLYAVIQDDQLRQALEDVQVSLVDIQSGQEVLNQVTGSSGEVSYNLQNKKQGDKVEFLLRLEKKGYLRKTITYHAQLQEPGQIRLHELMKFELNKIEVGMDIGRLAGVQEIYFDLGKFNIRPDAATELNKIVTLMKENPEISIELGSHTDARGSETANMNLSDKRAKASADYIVSQGIEAARVVGKGYGESKIKNRCLEGVSCSEEEHQQNRRTDFTITGF